LKIISGGQTGVDQSALFAAIDCGIEAGGWCPPGRVCESGVIPGDLPLQETPADRSPDAPDIPRSQRTEWNVRDADASLVFHFPSENRITDQGIEWTIRCTKHYHKPYLLCDPGDNRSAKKIMQWLKKYNINILNVAGPSELSAEGIGDKVYRLIVRIVTIMGISKSV